MSSLCQLNFIFSPPHPLHHAIHLVLFAICKIGLYMYLFNVEWFNVSLNKYNFVCQGTIYYNICFHSFHIIVIISQSLLFFVLSLPPNEIKL